MSINDSSAEETAKHSESFVGKFVNKHSTAVGNDSEASQRSRRCTGQ